MTAKLRELREMTRGRLRQIVVGLFFLGLLYAVSGARPLLLGVIVLALWCASNILEREHRRESTQPDAEQGERVPLDYEQSLEVLLGMVGRDVIVLLARRGGSPPGIAQLEGTLRSAEPDSARYRHIDPAYSEQEVLFFEVEHATGFWLPRTDFATAYEIRTPGRIGIELLVGDLTIAVFDDQASRLSEITMEREA